MTRNIFSVPIFFIVFRETLEAAIIVSVLLGLVEQIVHDGPGRVSPVGSEQTLASTEKDGPLPDTAPAAQQPALTANADSPAEKKKLMRKLRFQIFLGSGLGLLISLGIGGAFIAVWFTQASDLWSKSETLWEGVFELIASLMIFVMGVTMLKMDRAKAKWRIKLQRAFNGQHVDGRTQSGRWVLFILPFITVLREGMEAVVFVGGVSLGQQATSIPIAAIVGLCCGLVCGFFIYEFASRTTLTVFLIVMTNFILLIGAGLFSKAVGAFQQQQWNVLVGGDIEDTGVNGPGSYDIRGNVWHLDCCNPEATSGNQGWLIFGAVFGWTNSATVGSILSYVFYWLAVVVVLVHMKFKEGRTKFLGRESPAGVRRRQARQTREASPESNTTGASSAC